MHDWHLRDEVFGSARKSQRWRSARWLFGAMSRPHVVENSSDDIGLGHFANHAQLATTARAVCCILHHLEQFECLAK